MGVHIPVRKRVIGSASLLHKPVWGDVERTYAQKVLALGPIAYWPLWEASGTTAQCLVNAAQNGTYSSNVATWPVGTGIGDGHTSPQSDGTNDYTNIYTLTFDGAFNGAEGSASLWCKVANIGVWTDATARYALRLSVDANNYIIAIRSTTNNLFIVSYVAGGVIETNNYALSTVDWFHIGFSWSAAADEVRYYLNGVWQSTDTVLGVWAGTFNVTSTCILAANITPVGSWYGSVAHVAIWDEPLGASSFADLARV